MIAARWGRSGSRLVPVAAAAAALVLGCGDARPVRYGSASSCSRCHGSPSNPAPPTSIRGDTSTEVIEVGAHQLHLRDTPIRTAVACSECHVVPSSVGDPGHFDDPHARITWGPLATARGAAPSWNRDTRACSGVYCHGATLRAPPVSPPLWTYASEPPLSPPSAEVCGRCHGYPPPAPHPQLVSCQGCHPLTVQSDGTIDVAGGHHVDGRVDVGKGAGGLGCDLCHGYPPSTGAHAAHVGFAPDPATATYGDTSILQDLFPTATPVSAPQAYSFGCGNCHPLDPAKHMDGEVELELHDPAAPVGSLKARASPAATYANGTCSGVYCHSSGQESPGYKTTPAWTSGSHIGCAGCHDDPPRYESGGPGTSTANSHLVMAGDGYESGHFGGFPSAWPGSNHGSAVAGHGAAPVTCQTCHFDTVDPGNTGPSAFYYLDTSGDYRLPGGLLNYDCTSCHTGAPGAPPQAAGNVLPLRHVNGSRDVAFDARTALPPYAGLPAPPNTPTRPYWEAPGSLTPPFPAGMGDDGTTLSAHLGAATYASATKTCSNVACHLQQTSVQWGGPEDFTSARCNACHGL